MKRANSQEPKSEASHSCFSNEMAVNEQASSGSTGRSKSAAVLGLALSFGASGVLFADSEATAAVGSFVTTNSATSSESPQLPSVLSNQLRQPLAGGSGATVYHTVEQGDSLWQIAQEHQVELQDIKVANRISPDATLQVGQVIKVPGDDVASPSLVSLLPGVQQKSDEQSPSLERLVAGIPARGGGDEGARQSEISNVSEQPAVVATAELTGDTSLRSAGLVSQSDGFQSDLAQLTTGQPIAASKVSVAETETPQPEVLAETTATFAAGSFESDAVDAEVG